MSQAPENDAGSTPGDVKLFLQLLDCPSNGLGPKYLRTVIAPSDVNLIQKPGTGVWHIQGQASIGFYGIKYLRPTNVSFMGIQVREGSVPAIGIGYFLDLNGLQHPVGDWFNVGAGDINLGCKVLFDYDEISSGPNPPDYEDGTFTWNIPNQYRVDSGAAVDFATVSHIADMYADGDMSIQKGASGLFLKKLNDPSSNY